MTSKFQACALVSAPAYPNAIAWSEENLIAVATGHIVTILNPALPSGPRGLIMLPTPEPFQIGVIKREDLSAQGMLPICLSRYVDRPCARSVSWSPIGMAPNAGCLLAVCTIEGQVKVYRAPFLEYQAEWVEVIDITDFLLDHFVKVSFEESSNILSEAPDDVLATKPGEQADDDNLPLYIWKKKMRKKDGEPLGGITKLPKTAATQFPSQHVDSENEIPALSFHNDGLVSNLTGFEIGNCPHITNNFPLKAVPINQKKQVKANKDQPVRESKSKSKPPAVLESSSTISAEQYVSRNAMMSSLVVQWSPLMSSSSEAAEHDRFSVLAVGGKSGDISFWRIKQPHSHSVTKRDGHIPITLAGFLHAHNTWISAISWMILDDDLSKGQVLLVSASTDGSVRIWFQHKKELLKSPDQRMLFCLFKEIAEVESSPASALSVVMPVRFLNKTMIAVGRGSGSFEVWACNTSEKEVDKIGSYDAHDHVITGLAWAFDGRCLYSCSQDNSIRCWVLQNGSLFEAAIPSNTLGLSSSKNIPNATDSSFGIAISPGNLVLAVARTFDTSLLDQMYQARILKGVVEFFWIGGQEVDIISDVHLEINLEARPEFSEKELAHWHCHILSTLRQFQNLNKTLVVWDLVAALQAFKQSAPEFAEYLLVRWLTTICEISYLGCSSDEILTRATTSLQNLSWRNLHIINIICRRVVLSELKAQKFNTDHLLERSNDAKHDFLLPLWIELLSKVEKEIRERLVGISCSAASFLMSCSSPNLTETGIWRPLGVAQMEQWVALSYHVSDELKLLASEVRQLNHRATALYGYVPTEQCTFCSASVPFESPEVATCQGGEVSSNGATHQCHTLERCSVSMRVCPNTPSWFCVCCKRRAFTTPPPPQEFFRTSRMPSLNVKSATAPSPSLKAPSKPICPFCGILQQRQQPAFLLSPSPV